MKQVLFFAQTAVLAAALSMLQCSSSSNKTSTSPDAGSAGQECTDYCTAIMANCTGGDTSSTSNQQYSSMDNCMAVCSAFPVGSPTDTFGNTLGCRLYHARAAATNATLHCPHAGPGGDGTCGDVCVGYCQIVEKYCTGTSKIYASNTECMSVCNATPNDEKFNISIQDGNHAACLLYHAQESPLAPADHCLGDLEKRSDAGASGSVTCQ